MPIIYIYNASDFVSGLPDEDGRGGAAGSPPHTITLQAGASPIAVEINDSNSEFNETDTSQTLVNETTINGVTYPAGTPISGAYTLGGAPDGHQVSAIHLGSGVHALGHVGPVQGLASTIYMEPGTSYTFTSEISTYRSPIPYPDYIDEDDVPPCYAPGTLIDTPDGPRPVESLRPGDQVVTQDRGPQTVRWVSSHDTPLELAGPDEKPVLIKVGALGANRPNRDLIVSPQHRILVGEGGQLTQHFSTSALVPAKSLTSLPGIRHMQGKQSIKWHHFACDRHEVVVANGCQTESLLLGPMVLKGLSMHERYALSQIFQPAPEHAALNGPPARPCKTVKQAMRCIERRENHQVFEAA